jgi:hypothetical protein
VRKKSLHIDCGTHILCCEEQTYRSLNDLLYAIKSELVDLGEHILNNLWYGTRQGEDTVPRTRKLRVFHSTIEKLRDTLRNSGDTCLSCSKIHVIIEGVKSLLKRNCEGYDQKGLEIDNSGLSKWIAQNPEGLGYEDWERGMYMVAKAIGFDLTVVDKKEVCNITFDLIKKHINCDVFIAISQKAKDCLIKYTIMRNQKDCDTNYVGILKKKDCEVQYKALSKKKECKIPFYEYVNIVNCGITTELISKIVDCGLSLKFNSGKGCPVLVSQSGESDFLSFSVNNETELWQKLSDLNIL